MPGLGGLEMIGRVKEIRPEVQVILLTGRSSPEDAQEGRTLGAFDYLTKPVQIGRLIQVLRHAGTEEDA
jgi:DNA-binding NtrC family response regulator